MPLNQMDKLLATNLMCLLVVAATAASAPAAANKSPHYSSPPTRPVTKIALEEHVAFRDMWPLFNHNTPPLEWFQHERELTDLEDGRLAERIAVMDKANIAVMILSMSGDTQALKDKKTAAASVRSFNKRIADAVALYPKRFRFWCTLPLFDVKASIAELEWCMSKPSCPGALINGYSTDGPGDAAPSTSTMPPMTLFGKGCRSSRPRFTSIHGQQRPAQCLQTTRSCGIAPGASRWRQRSTCCGSSWVASLTGSPVSRLSLGTTGRCSPTGLTGLTTG